MSETGSLRDEDLEALAKSSSICHLNLRGHLLLSAAAVGYLENLHPLAFLNIEGCSNELWSALSSYQSSIMSRVPRFAGGFVACLACIEGSRHSSSGMAHSRGGAQTAGSLLQCMLYHCRL